MTGSIGEFDEKVWASLKKELKKTVGDTAYNNWLKQITFLSIENQTISLIR